MARLRDYLGTDYQVGLAEITKEQHRITVAVALNDEGAAGGLAFHPSEVDNGAHGIDHKVLDQIWALTRSRPALVDAQGEDELLDELRHTASEITGMVIHPIPESLADLVVEPTRMTVVGTDGAFDTSGWFGPRFPDGLVPEAGVIAALAGGVDADALLVEEKPETEHEDAG